jgi:sialate O-acetylesterase
MEMNKSFRIILSMFSLKIFLTVLLLIFSRNILIAQDSLWQNKTCAVSLTYDDVLNVHLDKVIPLLDSLGFRATFYLTGYFPGLRERLNDWKATAEKGNELETIPYFIRVKEMPGREMVNPNTILPYIP